MKENREMRETREMIEIREMRELDYERTREMGETRDMSDTIEKWSIVLNSGVPVIEGVHLSETWGAFSGIREWRMLQGIKGIGVGRSVNPGNARIRELEKCDKLEKWMNKVKWEKQKKKRKLEKRPERN